MAQCTFVLFDKKPPQRFIKLWQDYLKRLGKWNKTKVVHFSPSMISHLETARTKDFDTFSQHKALSNSVLVVLDEKGEQWTTLSLSNKITQWENQGCNITFIVGPSYGLDSRWRAQASYVWSLSSLTFPHDFAQLILIEQVYRAYSIIKSHPYHCDH